MIAQRSMTSNNGDGRCRDDLARGLQSCVRKFLSAQGSNPRRAQSDLPDRAHLAIGDDEVAQVEWPIEVNGERREKVAEDVLHGEGGRYTSHSETGNERAYFEAQLPTAQK